MTLSNAERQRRHRQRTKARIAAKGAEAPPWELPEVNLTTMTDDRLEAEIKDRWRAFEPVEQWMKAAIAELERRTPAPLNSLPPPSPFEILSISIAKREGTQDWEHGDVQVPPGRKPAGDVTRLARSINEIGLLNPITVQATQIYEPGGARNGYSLIAGLHRLEACLSLGHETIRAHVVAFGEDLQTDLAEIDEDLIRNELPLIHHVDLLWRRGMILEALADVT